MNKSKLSDMYLNKKMSIKDIAHYFNCSTHKVSYWLDKHDIPIRSISEAIYVKNHPKGDPFELVDPQNTGDGILFGLGLGLYWGEGTKADPSSVRLGNTDPELLKKFMSFMQKFFKVKKDDFKFGLQLFNDMSTGEALDFWVKKLRIKHSQFYSPIVTKSGSIGTYRKKSRYGVLTVYYHNKKLRDILVNMLPM